MPVNSRTHGMQPDQIGAIVLRDDWTCAYCLRRLEWAGIVFDHVMPRCDHGSDGPLNRVVCCHSCNFLKGSDPVPEDAVEEVRRRLASPLNLAAGQTLAEQHYGPWAAERKKRCRDYDRAYRERRRRLATTMPGTAFPFGANAGAS